ncbi:MAG: DNA cytosine methyltransferase [Ruminococcus sp.]|nr:DNA cytosine methyltransferase [Ruminococcus sp.]MBQ4171642.1 DNA cytosine methyltransferase [Ruminococcus sp.]
MNILVACEESQRVCTAFRAKGHRAFNCDIIEPSGNHPEWHIKADVLPLLNGNCEFTTLDGKAHRQIGRWDMIIAFPPCTYMTAAGACRMYPQKGWISPERIAKAIQARDFFLSMLHADCGKIAVENPKPLKVVQLPKESQRIQPYEFGEPYSKLTYLWLKGLPDLRPTNIVEPRETWIESGTHRNAGTQKNYNSGRRKKLRSKTFQGIADAMAEQWG